MEVQNIGETGTKSIRIAGYRISELNWMQLAHTRESLKLAEDTERLHKIEGVLLKYPSQHIPYLNSRIIEAEDNIKKFRAQENLNEANIEEYVGLIALCARRDIEITNNPNEEKIIRAKYPLYQVDAMKQQIEQFRESAERFHEAIDKEQEAIGELKRIRMLCELRDRELGDLGVELS